MTILNIILSAYLFCQRGRGGRFWYLTIMLALIGAQVHTVVELSAWVWVIVVMGTFPTQCLFSGIHGYPPGRDDSKWFRWMAIGAGYMATLYPFEKGSKARNRLFGCLFGVMRALPAMLAIPLLGNPLLALLLFHGFIYYAAGRFSAWFETSHLHLWMTRFMKLNDFRYLLCQPVMIAEILTGALIGSLIY